MALPASNGAVRFAVRVSPRASRERLSRAADGGFTLSVTAPPVDGEANAAVVAFFARLFDVKKRDVAVVIGEASRSKTIEVAGVTHDAVFARLAEASR